MSLVRGPSSGYILFPERILRCCLDARSDSAIRPSRKQSTLRKEREECKLTLLRTPSLPRLWESIGPSRNTYLHCGTCKRVESKSVRSRILRKLWMPGLWSYRSVIKIVLSQSHLSKYADRWCSCLRSTNTWSSFRFTHQLWPTIVRASDPQVRNATHMMTAFYSLFRIR